MAKLGNPMEDAQRAEQEGKLRDAVRFYKKAVAAGNAAAAKRLGDIYSSGQGEVTRDYAESVKYYKIARDGGQDVPLADRR